MKRRAPITMMLLITGLLLAGFSCSRAYKTGAAIKSADLIKALPEFPVALPPGGTNLYLEYDSHPPLIRSWLKVAVPGASLTNFLHSFGFADEFTVAPPQMIRWQKALTLPVGSDTRHSVSLLANMPRQAHHAAEWDVEKAPSPVRMYLAAKPSISSPRDKVILFGYVSEGAASNATVYLEYLSVQR